MHKLCFKTTPPPYSSNTFYSFLNNKNYCLVEDINRGFAIVRLVADIAELITLAVTPKFRRNGTAEKIMFTLFENVKERGANQFILEVAVDNTAAINLYKKLHFKKLYMRKNYFVDKCIRLDAIVFNKFL